MLPVAVGFARLGAVVFDIGAAVRGFLNGSGAADAVGGRVFVDVVPEHPVYPYVAVRTRSTFPATRPAPTYDEYLLDIEVCADVDGFDVANQVASQVRFDMWDFRGVQGEGVVAATDVEGAFFVLDDSVSPARPRWVCAVRVTAKDR